MAHQPGTKAEKTAAAGGGMSPLVRRLGFIGLAGMALTILAGVVLLPEYSRLVESRYQRDCLAAGNLDAKNLITTNPRLIEALETDEVIVMRLAHRQSDWLPYGEAVAVETAGDGSLEALGELVTIERTARPAKPAGRLITLASKLESPARRRGLLLMAGVAMITAMLMFGGGRSNRA